ncbi:MAG TPA: WYL domain-containing protein [Chloroflexia bacterium]|nr:WYL domain-containing protein [Chloroflexia bacterium]
MNRFDRALAILLLLRSGKTLSAPELARKLEVSTRTIYRDIETLSQVGVPVNSETGREGGFRLLEGYFLPPVTFTVGEATSLITGLVMLERLQARPFVQELDSAAHKLLAAVPDSLRGVLSEARQVINFEVLPSDIFHPERGSSDSSEAQVSEKSGRQDESEVLTVFLQSIFQRQAVELTYNSPYTMGERRPSQLVEPYGVVWDRNRWYLIGRKINGEPEQRMWRADRVIRLTTSSQRIADTQNFDPASLLERRWLTRAMAEWAESAPVRIRLAPGQAARLKRDWYYAHAQYEELTDGQVLMTFGESEQKVVFELLRWLGPGAELVAPKSWRKDYAAQLRVMLGSYDL